MLPRSPFSSTSSFILGNCRPAFKFTAVNSCLVLILLLFSYSLSFSFEIKNSQQQEVVDFRSKLFRLQQGIDGQKNKILTTDNQERNLLLELENLGKKLSDQQVNINNLEVQMEQQLTLIKDKTSTLATIHSKKKNVAHHLTKRIKAYYTMGGIGILNVTFSTKNLPELLRFHDSFNTLIKYDQNVIAIYQATIKDIERAKTALTLEESILQNFIDQAIIEKKEATSTKNAKEGLLEHIRTQGQLHKQAVKEMQQASDILADALVTLKSQTDFQENSFLSAKGTLPPPLDGVIVTLFNQVKVNKLGISRKSSGITLQAADGTNIKAVNRGTVIFSGYLRGYGNTVIINHGYQYYTVTSRIEKLLVDQGEIVKTADVLGIMGETATIFDEGLYFEVRHGKQSLDPLLWLDPNRLSTSE